VDVYVVQQNQQSTKDTQHHHWSDGLRCFNVSI
jgi:hypothetical protein